MVLGTTSADYKSSKFLHMEEMEENFSTKGPIEVYDKRY
jgi:hypothetical protein